MALTAGDKAECKEIAREIVKEVLVVHTKTCPHHQAYLISRAKVVGLIVGVVAMSGMTSSAAVAIVMKLLVG